MLRGSFAPPFLVFLTAGASLAPRARFADASAFLPQQPSSAHVAAIDTSGVMQPPSMESAAGTALRGIFSWSADDARTAADAVPTDKDAFLDSLDSLKSLNAATRERTELLNRVVENKKVVKDLRRARGLSPPSSSSPSLERPGSVESFAEVAPGTWSVVYAPHMTTMAGLAGGTFRVQYDLRDDGTTTSHAQYNFPLFSLRGYLSVSGTYGSEDGEGVCRVDFDEAWVKQSASPNGLDHDSESRDEDQDEPYNSIADVPDSAVKEAIRTIGRALFIKEFSVFPVSFLDDDLIVFDFELLGTRICARKLQ